MKLILNMAIFLLLGSCKDFSLMDCLECMTEGGRYCLSDNDYSVGSCCDPEFPSTFCEEQQYN